MAFIIKVAIILTSLLGKTFLASKLSNKVLPRGYSISTVGLSALYPADMIKENSIVFLDTAGTETPICY